MSGKHDRASELRAIADGRLMLNVRNGVTVSRSMLAKIADELDAERAALAKARRERDEAIKSAGDQATLRGEAEGKLAASEMAGIVDRWKRRAEAYRTQRDEALKALGMMLKEHDILSGNFGDVMDPKHKRPDRWPTAAEAARRALEAQGGE